MINGLRKIDIVISTNWNSEKSSSNTYQYEINSLETIDN